MIKVETANNPDFWKMESEHKNYYIRTYSGDKRRQNGNVTWRDIKITMTDSKYIDLSKCILSHDGNISFFLLDIDYKTVHVMSVNDQCHYQ